MPDSNVQGELKKELEKTVLEENSTSAYLLMNNAVIRYIPEPKKIELESLDLKDTALLLKPLEKYNEGLRQYLDSKEKHSINIEKGFYDKMYQEKGLTTEGLHPKKAVENYLQTELHKLLKSEKKLKLQISSLGLDLEKDFSSKKQELKVELPTKGSLYLLSKEEMGDLLAFKKQGGKISEFLTTMKLENVDFKNHGELEKSLEILSSEKNTKLKDFNAKNLDQKDTKKDVKDKNLDQKDSEKELSSNSLEQKDSKKDLNASKETSTLKETPSIKEVRQEAKQRLKETKEVLMDADQSLKVDKEDAAQSLTEKSSPKESLKNFLQSFQKENSLQVADKQSSKENNLRDPLSKKQEEDGKNAEKSDKDMLDGDKNLASREDKDPKDKAPEDKAADVKPTDFQKNEEKENSNGSLNVNQSEKFETETFYQKSQEGHDAIEGVDGFENYYFDWEETVREKKEVIVEVNEKKPGQQNQKDQKIDDKDKEIKISKTSKNTPEMDKVADSYKNALRKFQEQNGERNLKVRDLLDRELKNHKVETYFQSLPLSVRRALKEQAQTMAIKDGIALPNIKHDIAPALLKTPRNKTNVHLELK